jgi:hypothetical protein
MNRAVFIFTFLLKLSTVSKLDIAIVVLTFIGLLGAAYSGKEPTAIIEGFTSPPFLLFFGYSFSQDVALNSNSLRDGEYFALLFTRPLTRSSYVLTKALVVTCGTLAISSLFLGMVGLSELVMHAKNIVLIDGWRFVSLVANCFGFGCVVVLLRTLPAKIGFRCLFIFLSICMLNSSTDFSVKMDQDASIVYAWEYFATFLQNFLYPVIDFDALVHSTRFTWQPIIDYASNCLIYLMIAIYILNKREFSYAEN